MNNIFMYMFIIKYYCFPSKLVYTTYHNSGRKTNIINTIFYRISNMKKFVFHLFVYLFQFKYCRGGYFSQFLPGEIINNLAQGHFYCFIFKMRLFLHHSINLAIRNFIIHFKKSI